MNYINHSEKILSLLFTNQNKGKYEYIFEIPDNLILTSVEITKTVSDSCIPVVLEHENNSDTLDSYIPETLNDSFINIKLMYREVLSAFEFNVSGNVKKGTKIGDTALYCNTKNTDIMDKNLGRSITVKIECTENSQFFLYAKFAKINPLGNFSDVFTLDY